MSGSKTAHQEQAQLAAALGGAAYAAPATWYVALSLSAFDPALDGASLNEPTGASYARVAIANDTTTFPAGSGVAPFSITLAIDVAFAQATEDWGTILSAYLCDAATGGNACYGADATDPTPVLTNGKLTIPANTWVFQEI